MYDHGCDHRDGHVREKILDSEILRVGRSGDVILEQVPVGICDGCGMRYYHATVLRRAEEAYRTGGASTVSVPVAPLHAA